MELPLDSQSKKGRKKKRFLLTSQHDDRGVLLLVSGPQQMHPFPCALFLCVIWAQVCEGAIELAHEVVASIGGTVGVYNIH